MPSIALDQVVIDEFAPEVSGGFEDELSREHLFADADVPAPRPLKACSWQATSGRSRPSAESTSPRSSATED